MKRLLALGLTLSTLGLSRPAQALELTVLGGLNFAKTAYEPDVDFDSKIAFSYGGLIATDFATLFTIETGALFMNRKVADALNSYRMSTFQIPLLLRVSLPIVSFGAGAYYAFKLGDITQEDLLTGGETDLEPAKSGDFGLMGNVRLSFPFAPTMAIVLDGRYSFGLTNQSETAGETAKTRDLAVFAGLNLSL